MALQRLTENDIVKQLGKSGLAQGVRFSQALEAFRLYVQSELPEVTEGQIEPLFIRHNSLVVRTYVPAVAQLLKDKEADIIQFIEASSNIRVRDIRFRA